MIQNSGQNGHDNSPAVLENRRSEEEMSAAVSSRGAISNFKPTSNSTSDISKYAGTNDHYNHYRPSLQTSDKFSLGNPFHNHQQQYQHQTTPTSHSKNNTFTGSATLPGYTSISPSLSPFANPSQRYPPFSGRSLGTGYNVDPFSRNLQPHPGTNNNSSETVYFSQQNTPKYDFPPRHSVPSIISPLSSDTSYSPVSAYPYSTLRSPNTPSPAVFQSHSTPPTALSPPFSHSLSYTTPSPDVISEDMDIIFSATALLKMQSAHADLRMSSMPMDHCKMSESEPSSSSESSDTEYDDTSKSAPTKQKRRLVRSRRGSESSVSRRHVQSEHLDSSGASATQPRLTVKLSAQAIAAASGTSISSKRVSKNSSESRMSAGGHHPYSRAGDQTSPKRQSSRPHSFHAASSSSIMRNSAPPSSNRDASNSSGSHAISETRPRSTSRSSSQVAPITGQSRPLIKMESAYTPISPSLRHASSWIATEYNVQNFEETTEGMDDEQKQLLKELLDKFGAAKLRDLELIYKPATKRKPTPRWIPSYVFQKCLTIEEVFQEYKYGVEGMISLAELDEDYGSEWVLARKDIKHEKFRRMRVVRELFRIQEVNGWDEKELLDWVGREFTEKGVNARKWGDSLPKTSSAQSHSRQQQAAKKQPRQNDKSNNSKHGNDDEEEEDEDLDDY